MDWNGVESLNSCDLVAGRAVIFRELRRDDDLRVEFAGNDKAYYMAVSNTRVSP
jgi:hypothetical protein